MIDVSPNIGAYFEEIVRDAVKARNVDATNAAEHYLAGLLTDFARGQPAGVALDQPFTFQLRDALQANGAERFNRLRCIGDRVLYVLGFFSDSVKRRGADPEYVMSVGSSAYGHASAMMRLCGTASGHDVLSELADGYAVFVGVMTEIAEAALVAETRGNGGDILRIYERWQATGSPRLAAALSEMGLSPVKGSGDMH